MNINDVLALAHAGYTKSDIAAMVAAEQNAATPAPVPPAAAQSPAPSNPPAVPAAEPEAAPIPPNPTPAPDALQPAAPAATESHISDLISAGFAALSEKLNGISPSPSLNDVAPVGLEDILTKFYKED